MASRKVLLPDFRYEFDTTAEKLAYVFGSNDVGAVVLDNESAQTHRVIKGGSGYTCLSHDKVLVFLGTISSKASDAAVARAPSPVKGRILAFQSVINAALATGDATFTGKIGSTSVTDGVITVTQSSSAAGDTDIASPSDSADCSVNIGDFISLTCGGTSTATGTANLYAVIQEG